MDDILMASNNKDFLLTIKEWLSSHFEMEIWEKLNMYSE